MSRPDPNESVIRYWLARADDAISSARLELGAGHYEFAVNRAYYAGFYALSALLLSEGKRFVKHSGVRSALHSDLVKGGRLDRHWGQTYDRLFESRHRADYVDLVRFDAETAAKLVGDAEGFVAEMKRLLAEGK